MREVSGIGLKVYGVFFIYSTWPPRPLEFPIWQWHLSFNTLDPSEPIVSSARDIYYFVMECPKCWLSCDRTWSFLKWQGYSFVAWLKRLLELLKIHYWRTNIALYSHFNKIHCEACGGLTCKFPLLFTTNKFNIQNKLWTTRYGCIRNFNSTFTEIRLQILLYLIVIISWFFKREFIWLQFVCNGGG